MHGEFPIPRNFDDVHVLGEVMKIYNTSKVWVGIVDGDLGYQNGEQEFRNYYTNEFIGKWEPHFDFYKQFTQNSFPFFQNMMTFHGARLVAFTINRTNLV